MGPNLMSSKDRNPVIETAQRTVAAQLAAPEYRDILAALPAGDERRVRRPDGDPALEPRRDPRRNPQSPAPVSCDANESVLSAPALASGLRPKRSCVLRSNE